MADQCRSCQADVLWLVNATTGKRAPIDRDPTPDGNVVVLDSEQYQVLGKAERADALAEGVLLRKNHFATCAQSRSWQGGRRAVREP